MSHYYNNASNESFTQNINATTNATTSTSTNTNDDNNDVAIDLLWITILHEISTMESLNVKNLPLPFGRVKKIMKTIDVALLELKRIADESEENSSNNHNNNNDGNQIDDRRYRYTFMIANEVPYVMAKAAEMFIRDITTRAWFHTDQNRRKTIQRPDVIHATSSTEMYDFLIDVIPHATTECSNTNDTTVGASPDPVMYTEMPLFNQQPPTLPPMLPPSGKDVVPTESPLPSDVTQQPSLLEQQQQQEEEEEEEEEVTINDEFPTSYTTMSLPPNPLTTNMVFSPLTTTTTTTNETQPNHHDHHLDTKTSPTDPDEQQQQQHSTATPSYDDDDALSSHPQEWTLE